jgi:hypothetical protein
METNSYNDHAENMIKVRQLIVLVEQFYNNKQHDKCLEAVTELCVEARTMKTRLHSTIGNVR